ncbi:hypothetical protein SCUP515_07279 [Seiridium cupressi]
MGALTIIVGALALCATVTASPYKILQTRDPPAALPEKVTADDKKWQPAMDFDTDSCYNTPAIDANGNVAPGLDHENTGLSTDCHDLSDFQNNNVYSRARCNNGWCAYMYDYYFEKDVAIQYFPLDPGHRHDWEHIVIFVQDGVPKAVAASQHGDYETKAASDVRWDGNHPKMIFHLSARAFTDAGLTLDKDGLSTHCFRFANADDDNIENALGEWFYGPVVSYNGFPTTALRDKLMGWDFGSASIGIKDASFQNQLENARKDFVPGFDSGVDDGSPGDPYLVTAFPRHPTYLVPALSQVPANAFARNITTNQKGQLVHSTAKVITSSAIAQQLHHQSILLGTRARSITMSSKLIPLKPSDVMVIRDITSNVTTLSVPFSRFGVVRVGGRATIVRLTSGSLAVISPVALTPEVKEKLAQLGGNVAYLIASDIEHHIFISEWAREFPNAKLIGPKGLQEKRDKTDDEKIGKEKFSFIYTPENHQDNNVDADFAANFEVEYMDSHPNKEIVLLYKPEKILIQADLMFNLPCVEQYSRVPEAEKNSHGFINRLFSSFQGTEGEAKGIKRFLWYGMSSSDRPAFNKSVERINSWDFVTNIPCHGETMVGNAKEKFEKVFEWHLQGHK